MPLYDYRCPAGHVFERRAGYDEDVTACSCGEAASRQAVNRIGFSGFAVTPTGQQDFREDYRRFQEASETIDYKVSQRERDTGTQINVPLYKAAKKRADKLASLGVTADQIKT